MCLDESSSVYSDGLHYFMLKADKEEKEMDSNILRGYPFLPSKDRKKGHSMTTLVWKTLNKENQLVYLHEVQSHVASCNH